VISAPGTSWPLPYLMSASYSRISNWSFETEGNYSSGRNVLEAEIALVLLMCVCVRACARRCSPQSVTNHTAELHNPAILCRLVRFRSLGTAKTPAAIL